MNVVKPESPSVLSLPSATAVADPGFGTPDDCSDIFHERCDEGVADPHLDQRESPCVLGEPCSLFRCNLPRRHGQHEARGRSGVEPNHLFSVKRASRARGGAYCFHLAVVFRISVARQIGRWIQEKVRNVRDAERRDILPVVEQRGGAAGRELVGTGQGRRRDDGRQG